MMKTVTRSPFLGFRPRAAWQSTMVAIVGGEFLRLRASEAAVIGGGEISACARGRGAGGSGLHAREYGSAHLALGNLDAEELRHGDAGLKRARADLL